MFAYDSFVAQHTGFPKIRCTFWGPHKKDYSILGSILGSPYFGKLPYLVHNAQSEHVIHTSGRPSQAG